MKKKPTENSQLSQSFKGFKVPYNIACNNSSYIKISVNQPDAEESRKSLTFISKNENRLSSSNISLNKKFVRPDKPKVYSHKLLTPMESIEIKKIIEGKVLNQMNKAKRKLSKKIEIMNKIGVVSTKANQIRGMSLLSIESSFIEKQIPNYTRIATGEILKKRRKELAKDKKNARSEVLDKIKSILLKDYVPTHLGSFDLSEDTPSNKAKKSKSSSLLH